MRRRGSAQRERTSSEANVTGIILLYNIIIKWPEGFSHFEKHLVGPLKGHCTNFAHGDQFTRHDQCYYVKDRIMSHYGTWRLKLMVHFQAGTV